MDVGGREHLLILLVVVGEKHAIIALCGTRVAVQRGLVTPLILVVVVVIVHELVAITTRGLLTDALRLAVRVGRFVAALR